jgi:GntR family transcriptional regulator
MEIDKSSVVPLYYQLAEMLKDRIRRGEIKTGQPLPSETELIEKYELSRGTVRQALQLLTQEKLIERFPGKGSFVAQAKLEHDVSKAIGFFTQIAKDAGRRPAAKVLKQEIMRSPDVMAEKLNIPAGEHILSVQRIRYVDGEPWAVESAYFNNPVADLIKNENLSESIYDLIQDKYKMTVLHSNNVISSALADEIISEALGIGLGDPVFSVTRVVYLNNNIPFEYSADVYRGDRISLKLDMSYQKQYSDFNLEMVG